MMNSNSKFMILNEIIYRKDGNDFVIIPVEGEQVFETKAVSSFIWQQIIDGATLDEIHHVIKDTYEGVGEQELKEVDQFINQLLEKKIISII